MRTVFNTMNIWQKKKKKERTVNPETWDINETSRMAVSAYCLEESFEKSKGGNQDGGIG